jgi:hypothetical protein
MKNECKYIVTYCLSLILLNLLCIAPSSASAFAFLFSPPDLSTDTRAYRAALLQSRGKVRKAVEIKWPEQYIDPTFNYGLKLVLPEVVRKGLSVDAGYDRWEGLPTMRVDYFLPIKAWTDKSVFFSPRVCLTGQRESFSLGAGFRHLINSDTMVGFHAFHDWVRPRRSGGQFLKEAGVGLDFAALPGRYSDVSLTVNAYFPVNQRRREAHGGITMVRESLPTGVDAQLGFLLPALVDPLDIRVNGQVHSYRAENTNLTGYKAGVTLSSRNGMLTTVLERERDTLRGDNYNVQGTLTLAFDWSDLLKGKIPFSAPYATPETRYSRNMRDSLHERVVRNHDLPTDRVETPLRLAADVVDRTVSFSGAFPNLPLSRVTVQLSQSPWRDAVEVVTDSGGSYRGALRLKPGTYRMRLIHKPTGRTSNVRTVTIKGDASLMAEEL